jgi:hypothetical protein
MSTIIFYFIFIFSKKYYVSIAATIATLKSPLIPSYSLLITDTRRCVMSSLYSAKRQKDTDTQTYPHPANHSQQNQINYNYNLGVTFRLRHIHYTRILDTNERKNVNWQATTQSATKDLRNINLDTA